MKTWNELIGKTVESIDDTTADNVVVVHFSDKTSTVIDTEAIGFGLYRPVLGDVHNYGTTFKHD
jgi:hypothetical protein